jgi:hypothetical protein
MSCTPVWRAPLPRSSALLRDSSFFVPWRKQGEKLMIIEGVFGKDLDSRTNVSDPDSHETFQMMNQNHFDTSFSHWLDFDSEKNICFVKNHINVICFKKKLEPFLSYYVYTRSLSLLEYNRERRE